MFRTITHFILMVLMLNTSLLTSTVAATNAQPDNAAAWQALRDGQAIVLIRHALAPGTGDPSHFNVEDCATQRNLSEVGRQQSAAIGQLFRDHAIEKAQVYSSRWCRCLETARLMNLATEVQAQPLLNSFYRQAASVGIAQTAALKRWLEQQESPEPMILVTHQVVITELTGHFPSSGEIVFIRHPAKNAGKIEVLATIDTM